MNAGLPLHDAVEVGREDVPQLAQTLPVVGGFQLLFLNGQLFRQAAAQILNGLAHGLPLLPHGALLIPDGVVHVQELSEGRGAAALAVFPDGAEGELLGRAVREGVIIGRGVAYVLVEEQRQLVGGGVHVQRINAGIRASGGKQRRLPAHQGGQSAQGIHQPVGQNVRPGGCEQVYITLRIPLRGVVQKVQLHNRLRRLIHETRQCRPFGAFVKADAPQTIQNPPLRGQQIQIAGASHQLGYQCFLHRKAHLVGAVEPERCCPLHGGLGDSRQLRSQKMLAQKHTEHGRLRRILRRSRRQVQPGGGGVGGEKQLFPPLLAAQMNNNGISGGLVDFLHPCADAPGADFLQHGG